MQSLGTEMAVGHTLAGKRVGFGDTEDLMKVALRRFLSKIEVKVTLMQFLVCGVTMSA
jgi:hypothetical protein